MTTDHFRSYVADDFKAFYGDTTHYCFDIRPTLSPTLFSKEKHNIAQKAFRDITENPAYNKSLKEVEKEAHEIWMNRT